MSLREIPARYYDKRITVQRRSISTDSIGATVETWNDIATNVPACIQPLSVSEIAALEQGDQYNASFRAFIPNNIVTVKNNDKIIWGVYEYGIEGVEKYKASRRDIGTGHHYQLYLSNSNAPKS